MCKSSPSQPDRHLEAVLAGGRNVRAAASVPVPKDPGLLSACSMGIQNGAKGHRAHQTQQVGILPGGARPGWLSPASTMRYSSSDRRGTQDRWQGAQEDDKMKSGPLRGSSTPTGKTVKTDGVVVEDLGFF